MTADDEKIAGYIQRLTALLQQQIDPAKGWPASFVLPEPQNDAERTALSLFLAEVERETGASVKFTTEPGHA
ncbi:MAG: hypothetical protein DLM68_00360 [Hyphomicrobiales bacterium]|nr:MAG: hypothetical protein DLM68_00360 [Hyphomicrobiales bacterium]